LAKTLTLCLDRWADIQVEQAIQEASLSSLVAPVTVRSTLPIRTQLTISASIQSAPSPDSPNPPNQHQQLKNLPFRPSNPIGAEFFRPAARLTAAGHVAPFLIVDDNDVNRKLLSAYLSRKSFPFTTAVDGLLAVEAYKATRGNFSCVFMDIQMPRMDGIAAARAIRGYERQEKLEAVTIVALTGLATEEKQREAEANGFNEFFAKPVRFKALDVILERTARTAGYL
jgi:CheY-like chemotaxis protein